LREGTDSGDVGFVFDERIPYRFPLRFECLQLAFYLLVFCIDERKLGQLRFDERFGFESGGRSREADDGASFGL